MLLGFFIAILVNFVLKWVSKLIIHAVVSTGKTNEQLGESLLFNLAVASYIVNSGLFYINLTFLAALAVKEFIL